MDTLVLLAVLVAAVCHALWNALVKSSGDAFVQMTVVGTFGGFFGMAMLSVAGLPEARSWPYLFASMPVHQAYYCALIFGYKFGDLSDVYPIARGSAPMLVATGAYVFAGESLSLTQMFAVMLICMGILSLGLMRQWRRKESLALLFALLTGLTIATYTVVDGIGGRSTHNVLSYIGALFVLDKIPFLLLLFKLRRGRVIASVIPELKTGAIGGTLSTGAYAIVIWAMTHSGFALVSALRETSVVVAAYIGTRVMGESFGLRRIAAAVFVVIGVVCLHVF